MARLFAFYEQSELELSELSELDEVSQLEPNVLVMLVMVRFPESSEVA